MTDHSIIRGYSNHQASNRTRRLVILVAGLLVIVIVSNHWRLLDGAAGWLRQHRIETFHIEQGTVLWDSFSTATSDQLVHLDNYRYFDQSNDAVVYRQPLLRDLMDQQFPLISTNNDLILFSHSVDRPDGVRRIVVVTFYPFSHMRPGPFSWAIIEPQNLRCLKCVRFDLEEKNLEAAYGKGTPFRIISETSDTATSDFQFRVECNGQTFIYGGSLGNDDVFSISRIGG